MFTPFEILLAIINKLATACAIGFGLLGLVVGMPACGWLALAAFVVMILTALVFRHERNVCDYLVRKVEQ